jgi:hypothetical protein
MNDAKDGNLFPTHPPKRDRVPLTQKEIAILRLADAYGVSNQVAVKLILRLRSQKKAAFAKKRKEITVN